ncbi:hypothetical protein, partial [Burkholderia multivorans]|uniref:hypothetical protein n=1 Tax=Burkholderia multivorans TaxID=87883 RepID=UPI002870473E
MKTLYIPIARIRGIPGPPPSERSTGVLQESSGDVLICGAMPFAFGRSARSQPLELLDRRRHDVDDVLGDVLV